MKIAGSITSLFTDKIWTIDISQCSKGYARIVRFVKLLRITIDSFAQNRMGFQCVALSYFITLALIPFIAFLFAVTDGLGLSAWIFDMLHGVFPNNPEFINIVMDRATAILQSAKGGGLGLISALTFLSTVFWMMFQVERVFNNVWGIRKIPRKLYKRFGYYLIILILLPFILVLFGAGITYRSNITNLIGIDLSDASWISKFIGYISFYVVSVFTLSAMYTFIPAAKVRYKFALKSAAVAALVFVVFQYLYLETQVFVGRINSVYGVIAAIPLFLIWLNYSWQIIIYGAQLTYGYHNLDRYNIPDWDKEEK